MPGSATKNPDILTDDLIDIVDDIRSDVEDIGTRAYRVFVVSKSSTGELEGMGKVTEVETEITPRPKVKPWGSLKFQQEGCGLLDYGKVKIEQVSLSYTANELWPAPANGSSGYCIRIKEGYGQEQTAQDFMHAEPPYADRISGLGWILKLERAS